VPLKGPTEEDLRKLHAEVNQIVNQRFIITTVAITVSGVIISILVPKSAPLSGSDVGAFAYAGSILLMLVLLALFLYSHFLKVMIRVYTTYLTVTRRSNWEEDWENYRARYPRYLGFTRAQTIVFAALGVMAGTYPMMVSIGFGLSLEPSSAFALDAAFTVLYLILVIGIGWLDWWEPEKSARGNWENLKGS